MFGRSGQPVAIPAAMLIALGLALAACSGTTSGPLVLPSLPGPAQATAPSPVPHPPARTPREQVRAAVDRYFTTINQLGQHMDAAGLATLFTPSCPCRAQSDAVRRAAARGERYLDRIRVHALRVNVDGPSLADVFADYDLLRGDVVDAAGHRISRASPRRVRWDFQLARHGSRWLIFRIVALS